jgi:hypothetical protein
MTDIHEAFYESFSAASLAQLVRRVNKKLTRIVGRDKSIEEMVDAVLEKAQEEGWYYQLLVAAKKARPDKTEFQQACDAELSTLPEPGPAPQSSDWSTVNVGIVATTLIAIGVWVLVMLGVAGALPILAGVVTVIGGYFGLFSKVPVVRRLSRLLTKRQATYVLGGIAVVLGIASLFVGSVEVKGLPAGATEARLVRLDDGTTADVLSVGSPSLVSTSEQLQCRADNHESTKLVQPRCWTKLKISQADFRPIAQVLFVIPDEFRQIIPRSKPDEDSANYFKLKVTAKDNRGNARVLYEKTYHGDPLLLGSDGGELPPMPNGAGETVIQSPLPLVQGETLTALLTREKDGISVDDPFEVSKESRLNAQKWSFSGLEEIL